MSPIDLTPIFQAVIALLAALITARLIPWIKAHTTTQQRANMTMLVNTLVYAAEQLYSTQAIPDRMQWVRGELLKRGYTVDAAEIEAAVKQMKLSEAFSVEVDVDEGDPPTDPGNTK